MTQVIFKFNNPDGTPRADAAFEVRLTVPGLVDSENSVVLPQTYEMVTDANGEFTMELEPAVSLYKVRAVPENEDDCCGHTFSFYVPESAAPVYVQDLIMLPPPSNVPWDEEAMNKILKAVVDSKNSADAAHVSEVNAGASAVRAETAAQGVEDFADAAAASAAAASGSATAAGNSATAAAGSATTAKNEADRAKGYADGMNPSQFAPINSPLFTGDPRAPNPPAGDNDTSVATTAFVTALLNSVGWGLISSSPAMLDFDDATIPSGIYYTSSTTVANPPPNTSGGQGVVIHKIYGAGGFQLYSRYGHQDFYYRSRSGGTWIAWRQVGAEALRRIGLGDVAVVTIADINDATVPSGIYYTSTSDPNKPGNTNGTLIHKISGSEGFQLFQPGSTSLYYRRRGGGTWFAWRQIDPQVYGLGSPYQPAWPNTSIDDCSGPVPPAIYRTISTNTGLPSGFGQSCSLYFAIQNNTEGAVRFSQIIVDMANGRMAWRGCNSGTSAAPVWTAWKESAPLSAPAFTDGITVVGPSTAAISTYSLDISVSGGVANGNRVMISQGSTYGLAIAQASSGALNTGTTAFQTVLRSDGSVVNTPMIVRMDGSVDIPALSSTTVNATGNVNTGGGFNAIPTVASGNIATTMFNGSNTSNASYLQLAATPSAMNIVSGKTGTGAYLPLLIMAGGVQRMRFEANGVISFPTGGTRFQADLSNADNNLRAAFQTSTVNSGTIFNVIPNGTATTSNVVCHNTQDMNNAGRIRIAMSGGEAQLISDATGTGVNQPLGIYTNGIRRMLFHPSGEIILGAASTNGMWNGSVNTPGLVFDPVNFAQVIQSPNTNMHMSKFGVGNGVLQGFWVSGTGVGSISCNASTTAYNTTSDYRLKRDVREMPDCRAYFKALRPILHYWIAENADNTLPTAGFLAHELQEVFPQAVFGVKDAVDEEGNIVIQGVDYGKLTPYLSAAVKSLIVENEQQAEDLRVLKLQMAAVLEHLNLTVDTTPPPEAV